jgi:opacity protein-like surface antigen
MKKLLLAIGLAVLVAGSAQAVAVVEVVPPYLEIKPCTIFVVELVVRDVEEPGVEVVNLVLTYNSKLVEALGVEEGGYLPEQQVGEDRMQFSLIEENDMGYGVVSYTVVRLGSQTSVGSGTAALITFHCRAPGLTVIDYDVILLDIDSNIVASGVGHIEVLQTPEPMTLVLVGGALAALGFVARKRS